MSTIFFYNFWNNDTLMNVLQYEVCTAHHAYCVFLHYFGKK